MKFRTDEIPEKNPNCLSQMKIHLNHFSREENKTDSKYVILCYTRYHVLLSRAVITCCCMIVFLLLHLDQRLGEKLALVLSWND